MKFLLLFLVSCFFMHTPLLSTCKTSVYRYARHDDIADETVAKSIGDHAHVDHEEVGHESAANNIDTEQESDEENDEHLKAATDDEQETKALSLKQVTYATAVFTQGFLSGDHFILGASSQNQANFALTRAFLTTNSVTCQKQLSLVGFAPSSVVLNGDNTSNPLFDAQITNMALSNIYPVVTFTSPTTPANDNQLVVLVNDLSTGCSQLANVDEFLNDATGLQTAGIVALEASAGRVFTVLAPSGGTFGQPGSGIGVLNIKEKSLAPTDAQNGGVGNRAAAINEALIRIGGNANDITIFSIPIALHWDPVLNRLFVALSVINNSAQAGAVLVLVGRFTQNNQLILEPLTALNAALYTNDSVEHIIGFFDNAAASLVGAIDHVTTLRTTTNKPYLIVNRGVGAPSNRNAVYALPLVDGAPTGDGATAANVGKLAQKADCTSLVTANAHMTLSTDVPAMVGGGPLPILQGQAIQHLFTCDSAVFAAIAQDRSTATQEAGLFVSHPIYATGGLIRSWTPWQRVIGSVDTVFRAALDKCTGNYWYLTTEDGTPATTSNTIKVTMWGDGESSPGLLGGLAGVEEIGLVGTLGRQFSPATAGVHQLFDFKVNTPGFAPDAFSMMIAVGLGKVSLIETGNATSGTFTPTKGDFSSGLLRTFNSQTLQDLGPLCAAEVTCIDPQNPGPKGWIFVGGHGGLAVLSDDNGNGWSTLGTGFAGIGNDFTFKKLGSFTNVKKVVSDGTHVYVLTGKRLYRIVMNATKFSTTPADLDPVVIASPLGVTGDEENVFADFVLFHPTGACPSANSVGLLATNVGLFQGINTQAIMDTMQNSWMPVLTSMGRSLGSVVHIAQVFSSDGVGGNAFVTAGDYSYNVGIMYFFDVQAAGATPIITDPSVDFFWAIGELRTGFFTDGPVGYSVRPLHLNKDDFVKILRLNNNPLFIRNNLKTVDIGTNCDAFNIGQITLNSASGARVVPGDWGIKVNE